jgi:hypothetical protein
MTQGILIYAFNNQEIDYVKIAVEAARRAKHFLKKPVTLVTDSSDWVDYLTNNKKVFDQVIDIAKEDSLREYLMLNSGYNVRRFYDGTLTQKKFNFKNEIRTKTYHLSPYDETLVIDCDYLIANDNLKYVWEQNEDFLIWKKAHDLSGHRDTFEFERISDYTIDFYWATVFFFRKGQNTKIFFDLIDHIREEWTYYKLLYRFNSTVFRNDHAFSIAIHIMNGYSNGDWAKKLPGELYYTIDKDILLEMSNTDFKFLIEKEKFRGEYSVLKTKGINIHIMNKFSIGRLVNV